MSLFGDARELVWAVTDEVAAHAHSRLKNFSKLLQGNPFPGWLDMTDSVWNEDGPGTEASEINDGEQEASWIETQIGLKLPNGEIVWPPSEYGGYPIATIQDRATLLEVFKKTAVELHFEVDSFLQNYSWVSRELIITPITPTENTGEIPITDPSVFGETRNNDDCQDNNSGAVHEGSVGSTA